MHRIIVIDLVFLRRGSFGAKPSQDDGKVL